MLRARRLLRTLAVIQDMADALLTLPDLGGEFRTLLTQRHPSPLYPPSKQGFSSAGCSPH